jgi:hypothetical protein
MATPAVDNWFGGDITGAYAVLGLRVAVPAPTYSRVLPDDPQAFLLRVFAELGGKRVERNRVVEDPTIARRQQEEFRRNSTLASLADETLKWVALAEGLGRPPELKEFGARTIEYYGKDLADDPEAAWSIYAEAIRRALDTPNVNTATIAPDAGAARPTPAPPTVSAASQAPTADQLAVTTAMTDAPAGRARQAQTAPTAPNATDAEPRAPEPKAVPEPSVPRRRHLLGRLRSR